MYGYSSHTIIYWGIEAVITGLMAVLLALGIWKKWRFIAYVYPVGQLIIRASSLLFQPSDYGYQITLDKAALLIALCVFSALMDRRPGFGYVTTVGSVFMLLLTLPEGIDSIGTFFVFGGELIFLGLQIVFSALTYIGLGIVGIRFGGNKQNPPKKWAATQ